MTGKLKVIRALANPIRRRAKKKRAITKKTVRKKAARSLSGKWVARVITQGRIAVWWSGSKWSLARSKAKRYATAGAAGTALKTARKPGGWLVADVMPA